MNEALNGFVTEMTTLLKSAKDFTLEQAPEVLRQVVTRELVGWGFWAACWLVIVALGVGVFLRGRRCEAAIDREAICPIGNVISACGLFGVLVCAKNFLEVWVAPKVFLIEYFASLVKK